MNARILSVAAIFVFAVLLISFAEPRVAGLLVNTAQLAIASCLIAVPWGGLLAFALLRCELPGRRWCIATLLAMMFFPLFLQAAGWDAGFGRQGWFSLSHGSLATPILAGWRAAIWTHAVAAVPWVVLLVGLGVRYVEWEFEELALLETSRLNVMWQVTFRRAAPSILVAVLWVSLTAATEMTVTDLYQVRTLAEEVYLLAPQFSIGEATLPWRWLLLAVALFAVAALWLTQALAPATHSQPRPNANRFPLSLRTRLALTGFTWGSIAILLLTPIANLVINAGTAVRPVQGQLVRGWEWSKFAEIIRVTPERFAEEFGWTALLGVLSASVTLAVALPLAWWACRRRSAAILASFTAALGLAIPGPILGLCIIRLLNHDVDWVVWLYDRTLFAPLFALVCRALPIAVLVSWYALRSVSLDQLEMAATEGANAATRWRRIVLPQRAGAMVATWLAVFALATGDLSATILVLPPGVSTLSHRVFGLLHAGVDDQVAGLSLWIVAIFFALGWIALALWPTAATRVRAGTGSEYT